MALNRGTTNFCHENPWKRLILIVIFIDYKKMDPINLPSILFTLNKTTKIYHVYSHITFMNY